MRITFLRAIEGKAARRAIGEAAEYPDHQARDLITAGYAAPAPPDINQDINQDATQEEEQPHEYAKRLHPKHSPHTSDPAENAS